MIHVRAHLGMSVDKVFYTTQNGLIVANRGGGGVGESRRTRMHQGSHPGNFSQRRPGRTPWRAQILGQIQMYFFWLGIKKQVCRWVKACLGCRKRKTPRPMRAGITEAQLAIICKRSSRNVLLRPVPEIDQRKQAHFHNDRHLHKVASSDPSQKGSA